MFAQVSTFFVVAFISLIGGGGQAQEVLDARCTLYPSAVEIVCMHLNASLEWPSNGSWASRRVFGSVRSLRLEQLDGCNLHLDAVLIEHAMPHLNFLLFPTECSTDGSCVSVTDYMVSIDWQLSNAVFCNVTDASTVGPPTTPGTRAGFPTWATVLLSCAGVGLLLLVAAVLRKKCFPGPTPPVPNIPLRLFPARSYEAIGVSRL